MSHDLPEEFTNQVASLKQITSIHDLILRSSYEGFHAKRILEAQAFLEALHANVLEAVNASEHKDKVPGLLGIPGAQGMEVKSVQKRKRVSRKTK